MTRATSNAPAARGPLKVVAYITDSVAIGRILDHFELSPAGEATS